jgi:DNA-binding response OmpR family regulator
MHTDITDSWLWVVDRLDYWRAFMANTLKQAGFCVEAYRYEELPSDAGTEPHKPDLVVLGCARSRPEEQQIVQALVQREFSVLILSSTISQDDCRSLFLAGAADVSPRPHSPDILLSLVQSDLAGLAKQRRQSRAWRRATL